MSQRRFVVLDRDGTIIVERHYLSQPDQVELLPGAARGLRRLRQLGLGLVVVTNQSGIGRGYFDEAQLGLIHRQLVQLLAAEQVALDGIYYCPHIPAANCSCRKPKPGLLQAAARAWNFTPAASFVIGDKSCDIEMGQHVGATTLLVRTGYGAQVAAEKTASPDYVIDNLDHAAQVIEGILSKAGIYVNKH